MENKVQELVLDFFNKLNIKIDNLSVSSDNEKSFIYNIKLETEDSGIIIGPHGKNLDAIQSILKLLISKSIGEKAKIHLEINDYMKSKDERLFDFIKSKINLLEKNGQDIRLPFYSAYERKKIHSFVSEMENKGIYTKSIGEGRERRLYICKQAKKLEIDIDGDDI